MATATVSTTSTSAPYHYTITLDNTGTSNIGTLWFAWTDVPLNYDFLPSSPTNIGMPMGWVAPVVHNSYSFYGTDGYSIEFYNLTGSPLAPGHSDIFSFTSPDSPATIAGPAYAAGDKVTTSFIYGGLPQSDAGFQLNASVAPEPASIMLAATAAGLALLAWRHARRPARPRPLN
jgi:hypothetical protein